MIYLPSEALNAFELKTVSITWLMRSRGRRRQLISLAIIGGQASSLRYCAAVFDKVRRQRDSIAFSQLYIHI